MRRQSADSRHSQGRYVNTSPLIAGTPCDGCRCCEVLVRRRNKRYEERYWCGKKHRYEDPHSVGECDEKEDE